MADIFISYAYEDRALAGSLVAKLEAEGWTVWWDANLGFDDGYRDHEIRRQQIDSASVVLVIWTKASTNSRLVLHEADIARRADKLVPMRGPDLDPADLPLGFMHFVTPPVSDYGHLRRALTTLSRRRMPRDRDPPNYPGLPGDEPLPARRLPAAPAEGAESTILNSLVRKRGAATRSRPPPERLLQRLWRTTSRLTRFFLDHSVQGMAPPPSRDVVDCSVFAPPKVPRRATFQIQALLHERADLPKVAKIASRTDPSANRRAVKTLECVITRGAEVGLFLDCPDLVIANPLQSTYWTGEPRHTIWSVELAEAFDRKQVTATVYIDLDGIAVGEVLFTLEVTAPRPARAPTNAAMLVAAETPTGLEPQIVGDSQLRYSSAFVSYSRKDFDRVSLFAEGLEQNGMKLFVDVTSIEPGKEWANELKRGINESDVFYLMWSTNAAGSHWVREECQQAHNRATTSPDKRPRMKPVTLHREAPLPPNYLRHLEFNSKWLAQREAQKHPLFRR